MFEMRYYFDLDDYLQLKRYHEHKKIAFQKKHGFMLAQTPNGGINSIFSILYHLFYVRCTFLLLRMVVTHHKNGFSQINLYRKTKITV